MVGPIEFASDGPVDDKGPTEFGGRAGLIQGGSGPMASLNGMLEVHELTGSEKLGILVRGEAVQVRDAVTGLLKDDPSAPAVDGFTGQVVDPAWNEDGSTTRPVDIPVKSGPPTAGEL